MPELTRTQRLLVRLYKKPWPQLFREVRAKHEQPEGAAAELGVCVKTVYAWEKSLRDTEQPVPSA